MHWRRIVLLLRRLLPAWRRIVHGKSSNLDMLLMAMARELQMSAWRRIVLLLLLLLLRLPAWRWIVLLLLLLHRLPAWRWIVLLLLLP